MHHNNNPNNNNNKNNSNIYIYIYIYSLCRGNVRIAILYLFFGGGGFFRVLQQVVESEVITAAGVDYWHGLRGSRPARAAQLVGLGFRV